MATSWQILNTERQSANGLVVEVTYACTAQLNNQFDRRIDRVELTGDPSEPGFIPYENLTQDIVVNWVKEVLGSTEVSSIENTLESSVIAKQAAVDAQTVESGLPWL